MVRLRGAPSILSLLVWVTMASPAGAVLAPPSAQQPAAPEGYDLLLRLLSPVAGERRQVALRLIELKDRSLAPGLVDLLFFQPAAQRGETLSVLAALTGERAGERYHDWVELIGRREELAPKAGYLAFKAGLLARIDERYPKILYDGAPTRIRVEEIVWGGVRVEGIPALDQPAHLAAAEADYLDDAEKVFGVSVAGRQRAYPLRILDWHEMVNDVLGGEPITLSYCTLCGSGVLYSTRAAAGRPYTFGTSGLLYRSNKLMVDRQTLTLWNNLTGEPAVGRLARSPVRLALLPVTITTWGDWKNRHPATTVLALDRDLERRFGFSYVPGAADRRRAGVRFPVWQRSKALDDHAEIYALRLAGRAKAYPIARVLKERVVNDRLGEQNLVVVADPSSGAVRAYARGDQTFSPGGTATELRDGAGRRWRIDEEALTALEPVDGALTLPRLPGHQAFWFGWYSFFPETDLYGASR